MQIQQTTSAASEPVTLALAKLHCRVVNDYEDELFSHYISAVRNHCENYLNKTIASRQFIGKQASFSDCVSVDANLQSVDSIQYKDEDGTLQTISSSVYEVFNGLVTLATGQEWPEVGDYPDAVQITFTAGYDSVPDVIKQGMLLFIGHNYEHREAVVIGGSPAEIPQGIDALWHFERVQLGV